MADHQRTAPLVYRRVLPRPDDNLRPDAGRVALGDGNTRLRGVHPLILLLWRPAVIGGLRHGRKAV